MKSEPNITVHNETTRKSIKKLQLSSIGVWFLSMGMYAAAPEDPGSVLAQWSVVVWMLSLGMAATAMVKKWWHHG